MLIYIEKVKYIIYYILCVILFLFYYNYIEIGVYLHINIFLYYILFIYFKYYKNTDKFKVGLINSIIKALVRFY